MFAFLRGYKTYLLSTWNREGLRNRIDDLIFRIVTSYWWRFVYLAEKNPDKRESLKSIMMGGDNGAQWAATYNSGPFENVPCGRLTGSEASPILPAIDKILAGKIEPSIVIQIGSSSGREIAWLAERHTECRFIGTDIYSEIIAYSSEHHVASNLSFDTCPAVKIPNLLSAFRGQSVIVFSSGSLQYVQPEHLKILCESLNSIPKLQLYIQEPASELEGDPLDIKGSLWRGYFSYTHNYRFYCENAGLETEKCDIVRPYIPYEDFPNHKGVVHYIYVARTRLSITEKGEARGN